MSLPPISLEQRLRDSDAGAESEASAPPDATPTHERPPPSAPYSAALARARARRAEPARVRRMRIDPGSTPDAAGSAAPPMSESRGGWQPPMQQNYDAAAPQPSHQPPPQLPPADPPAAISRAPSGQLVGELSTRSEPSAGIRAATAPSQWPPPEAAPSIPEAAASASPQKKPSPRTLGRLDAEAISQQLDEQSFQRRRLQEDEQQRLRLEAQQRQGSTFSLAAESLHEELLTQTAPVSPQQLQQAQRQQQSRPGTAQRPGTAGRRPQSQPSPLARSGSGSSYYAERPSPSEERPATAEDMAERMAARMAEAEREAEAQRMEALATDAELARRLAVEEDEAAQLEAMEAMRAAAEYMRGDDRGDAADAHISTSRPGTARSTTRGAAWEPGLQPVPSDEELLQEPPPMGGARGTPSRRRHRDAERAAMRRESRRAENGRKKAGAGATCCALLVANCWLISLISSALLPLLYDGFEANEVDYWWPLRVCPKHAAPSYEHYDRTLPLGNNLNCKAANGGVTCGDGINACRLLNCQNDALATSSNYECNQCCGGTLRFGSSLCHFPFTMPSTFGGGTHSACTYAGSNASSPMYWCPLEVDGSTGEPVRDPSTNMMDVGECGGNCVQADYVAASAYPSCEPTCPVAGSAATPLNVDIEKSGWGGDAGFQIGAQYRLVLFSYSHYLRARIRLTTANGRALFQGDFARDACLSALGRRMSEDDGDDGDGDGDGGGGGSGGDGDGGWLGSVQRQRRALLVRTSNWLSNIRGGGTDIRVKEGSGARWNGVAPAAVGATTQCANNVESAGTQVYVQGSCDAPSGTVELKHSMMRAELGSSFSLSEGDFPLRLNMLSVNASLRGEEGYDALVDPELGPSLYATFYTEELDTTGRYLLWIGVPVGYLLLSCCGCCCLCFCCTGSGDGKGAKEFELADLTAFEREHLEREIRREDQSAGWARRRMDPDDIVPA